MEPKFLATLMLVNSSDSTLLCKVSDSKSCKWREKKNKKKKLVLREITYSQKISQRIKSVIQLFYGFP